MEDLMSDSVSALAAAKADPVGLVLSALGGLLAARISGFWLIAALVAIVRSALLLDLSGSFNLYEQSFDVAAIFISTVLVMLIILFLNYHYQSAQERRLRKSEPINNQPPLKASVEEDDRGRKATAAMRALLTRFSAKDLKRALDRLRRRR